MDFIFLLKPQKILSRMKSVIQPQQAGIKTRLQLILPFLVPRTAAPNAQLAPHALHARMGEMRLRMEHTAGTNRMTQTSLSLFALVRVRVLGRGCHVSQRHVSDVRHVPSLTVVFESRASTSAGQ